MRILGEGVFAVTLRPSEIIANTREDSDSAKRTFAKFEGMRLATVQETVGSRLNLPMLKILSGGDTLSGAKDASRRRPICAYPQTALADER